jgi:predicted 3-demethylubiquinone-9 3-methyltransferase (glyoxalase superfamily)
MQKLTPCLWFDTEGEDAATFYVSVFPNSRIVDVARYGSAGPRPEGTVMTVSFELDGQNFLALNGGPGFTFSEAISFQVSCREQDAASRGRSSRRCCPSSSATRTRRERSGSWGRCSR